MEAVLETKTEKISSLTKETIAFQRGMMITSDKASSKQKRLTIQAELMKFGYMLSKDALENVSVEWYEAILPFLKKSLGVGRYKPFYRNFPEQVMDMDESELFFNAICHYWSKGTWEPEYELERKGVKFEQVKFSMIELGTEKEFKNIFTTLVSINQSITENDREVIEWFAANYKESKLPFPDYFQDSLSSTDGTRRIIFVSYNNTNLNLLP